MPRSLKLALAALALAPTAVLAQQSTMRVDTLLRIVAVVGDSIITNVQLKQALEFWAANPPQELPPPGPKLDSLINELIQQQIDELVWVQAAQKDTTLKTTDEELRGFVDRQMDAVLQQQFRGDRARFEAAVQAENMTMDQYREQLSTNIKHQRMVQLYQQKITRDRKPPPVSDKEIRERFDQATREQGPPQLPPTIAFDQVVIPVTSSDSAKAKARALADSVLKLIRDGKEDFAQLARRFSEDPGSKDLGGDLGWFRPERMQAEFGRAASLLKPGEVSDPVETIYGFHIIKLEKIRGPERQARHILIRPALDDADKERARGLADKVVAALNAGASIDSLRREYGDRDEPPHITFARDSLPEDYRAALTDATGGQVVGPFELTGEVPKFAVVKVERVEAARPATVEDYRAQIQQQMAHEKQLAEIIADLRRATYIEIRVGPGASSH